MFFVEINNLNFPIEVDSLQVSNTLNSVSSSSLRFFDYDNYFNGNISDDVYVKVINSKNGEVLMEGLTVNSESIIENGVKKFYIQCVSLVDLLKDITIDNVFQDFKGTLAEFITKIIEMHLSNNLTSINRVIYNLDLIEINEISINDTLYDFLIKYLDEYEFYFGVKRDSEGVYLFLNKLNSTFVSDILDDGDLYYTDMNRGIMTTNDGIETYSDVRFLNAHNISSSLKIQEIKGDSSNKQWELDELPYLRLDDNGVYLDSDIELYISRGSKNSYERVPNNLIGFLDVYDESINIDVYNDSRAFFMGNNADNSLHSKRLVQGESDDLVVGGFTMLLTEGDWLKIKYRYAILRKTDYSNSNTRNHLSSVSGGLRKRKLKIIDDYIFGSENISNKGERLTKVKLLDNTKINVTLSNYYDLGEYIRINSILNDINEIYYVYERAIEFVGIEIFYVYTLCNVTMISDVERVEQKRKKNIMRTNNSSSIGGVNYSSGRIDNRVILEIFDNTPETRVNGQMYVNLNKFK